MRCVIIRVSSKLSDPNFPIVWRQSRLLELKPFLCRNSPQLSEKFQPHCYKAEKRSQCLLGIFSEIDRRAFDEWRCEWNDDILDTTHPPAVALTTSVSWFARPS